MKIAAILLAATVATWPAAVRAQAPAAAPAAAIATPAANPAPPMLGVVTERISEDLRHQFPNLQPGAGLLVREILPNCPAALAQVQRFDILVRWNDQLLVHPAQLQVLVASAKVGDRVTLEFLHQGRLTTGLIALAASPQGHEPGRNPLDSAIAEAMQNPELLKQAAATLGQAGIDPAMIAGALEGLDLNNLNLEALAPEALRAGKIVIITPDGKRQEFTLAEALKDGPKLEQILKNLDLGKIDPLALLSSRILLLNPDGSTQQEFTPADLLKNSELMNGLLQRLAK